MVGLLASSGIRLGGTLSLKFVRRKQANDANFVFFNRKYSYTVAAKQIRALLRNVSETHKY